MNKEQIKSFESFLAGRLAFTKFVDNVLKAGNTLARLYRSEYEEIILGAFEWSETPEGYDYWEELSDAWIEYTKTLN